MSGEYLQAKNWPECIPDDEWGDPDHDPHGLDEYPHSHPKAGSISGNYMGDVCPWCGVPLRMDEKVCTINMVCGELGDVTENADPCYHPNCWAERQQELNESLAQYVEQDRDSKEVDTDDGW